MQPAALKVVMWGTTIGYLGQQDEGFVSFQYDEDFLGSGIQISPLKMPLSQETYTFPTLPEDTFHGLPGAFADSLPDKFGTALLGGYLSSKGKSKDELTALERLCYTGNRGMGALEYEPAYEVASQTGQQVDLDELAKIAEAVLARKEGEMLEDRDGLVSLLMESSSSVGGARAKALIAINPETGEVRSGKADTGDGFEHWLIKFGNLKNNSDRDEQPDEDGYTRIEYAYYLMAKAAGINMEDCLLREEGGCAHFLTRRFDRDRATGSKIHMQTLCGLAHADFKEPRSYSYEQAFLVLRKIGLDYPDMLELFKRMVFNDFAKNYDDHTKNISFLMDKQGVWSLAPAYDVTYNYKPSSIWVNSHQMLIAGKSKDIDPEDLMAVAKEVGIRATDARDVMEQMRDCVLNWEEYAAQANIPEKRCFELKQNFNV